MIEFVFSGDLSNLLVLASATEIGTDGASEVSSFQQKLISSLADTLRDVLPIAVIVLFFQLAVLRRPIANPVKMIWGMLFVLAGLAFFLVGLEMALFPLGKDMARQLTDPGFLQPNDVNNSELVVDKLGWTAFFYTYLFAFCIGVSTAFAEPALIAVATKAQDVSGGAIRALGLRIVVSIGVGCGVALGTFRIIMGHSLPMYIIGAYVVVVVQTWFAPKSIIPLAYDSGGVTTSTVTVPLVAALGLGLSMQTPGRSPLIDGFGLIAFAALFPIISVLGYAQVSEIYKNWMKRKNRNEVKTSD